MNFQKMTKAQLEAHGRTIGIELDRRKSKKDLIATLNKVPKKKPVAKKAPAKNSLPPAPRMVPTSVSEQKVTTKKGFWSKLKDFFG